MKFASWEERVPVEIKADKLWRMRMYRLGLFLGDICWTDRDKLVRVKAYGLADQLLRATGSVSANIAEGYSRSSGKDRVRFYEYALGSARESRDWYFKARHVLGDDIVSSRLKILAEIIRLLLTAIPKQRQITVREPDPIYSTNDDIVEQHQRLK